MPDASRGTAKGPQGSWRWLTPSLPQVRPWLPKHLLLVAGGAKTRDAATVARTQVAMYYAHRLQSYDITTFLRPMHI